VPVPTARLQDENAHVAILGQPVGQRASRRTRSDNDVIVGLRDLRHVARLESHLAARTLLQSSSLQPTHALATLQFACANTSSCLNRAICKFQTSTTPSSRPAQHSA